MVTKTISNRVNRSLRSGHLVIGPVLFPAVSSRKRSAQALRWFIITKCSGILLTHFNGCASEGKANNGLYVYYVKMAAPWGSSTLLSFHSLCLHFRNHLTNGKYSRIRLRNTKPAQSLRRTFSKRNSRKKNRPITKWPPQRLLFTRLEIEVVPKVCQEGECCLEGLIILACGLQLQMLPRLNGHFMNVLVWFYT